MPHIIVQAEGDVKPLASWWIEEAPKAQEEQWDELCLRLIQEARSEQGRQDSATPLFNVFLLFHEEEFPDELQQSALVSLLERARRRVWGAQLFFVIPPLKISTDLDPIIETLGDWMNELLKERFADVLQVRQSYTSENHEPLHRSLRTAARQAKERLQVLHNVADHREWRCFFLTEHYEGRDLVKGLLHTLVATDPGEIGDSNLVIVVTDDVPPDERLKLCTEDPPRRSCVFATVDRNPPKVLSDFCKAKDLASPLVFHGVFELWYFLLRLNELRRWFPTSFQVPESIQGVQALSSPRLHPARQFPSLLFTSAFGSDQDEVGQWLTAAEEVGRLLCKVPHALESRIELAVQPERVIRALQSKPNVWIHMGHGSASSGLHIPGRTVTQEQWIDCCSQCDLRLALFLTCDSHEIARLFAKSGAGVAIGFEGKVESEKTWHLAEEVLGAMFSRGTSRQVILEGFDAGAVRFRGVQTLDAKPRAYYPRGRR